MESITNPVIEVIVLVENSFKQRITQPEKRRSYASTGYAGLNY
jgi:hypothetical protein